MVEFAAAAVKQLGDADDAGRPAATRRRGHLGAARHFGVEFGAVAVTADAIGEDLAGDPVERLPITVIAGAAVRSYRIEAALTRVGDDETAALGRDSVGQAVADDAERIGERGAAIDRRIQRQHARGIAKGMQNLAYQRTAFGRLNRGE